MNKVKDDFFLHSNEVGHISKEDYDKIELLVNAAKAFARSTYQCVYIIDYFHQDFIYASDNLAYLCGLEPEQLMEAGYQMYIDHVPDADLQMLLEVNKKGFDLFNELPVGDRLDYTISYDFHLTNGRHSRLIHHHLTPILLSDDGRVWLALCTVSLAATDEPGHIIMQKNGERSYSLPTMARDRTSGSISPPCLPQGSRECRHNSRRQYMPRCPVAGKTPQNNA